MSVLNSSSSVDDYVAGVGSIESPKHPEDTNDQLADKITLLAGRINAANYRFLKLIAEFDRRNAWQGPGIRSCAYWLHWQCGIAMNAAREKVRVAKAIEGLPEINTAFEKGELSFSKVRAMTRVATPDNESYLLNIARHGTTHHVETLTRAFRTASSTISSTISPTEDLIEAASEQAEDVKQAQKEQDARKLNYYQDEDGMWVIRARLPAEEGGLLVKVLAELGDRIALNDDRMSEGEQDSAPKNGAKNVSAETFFDNTAPDDKDPITFPQRRADAMVAMAEHYLASNVNDEGVSLASLKGSERCQLVLHVHQATLTPVKDIEDRTEKTIRPDANLDGRWLLQMRRCVWPVMRACWWSSKIVWVMYWILVAVAELFRLRCHGHYRYAMAAVVSSLVVARRVMSKGIIRGHLY